jgi:hypothetical protein
LEDWSLLRSSLPSGYVCAKQKPVPSALQAHLTLLAVIWIFRVFSLQCH